MAMVLTLQGVGLNVIDVPENPDGVVKMFQFSDQQSGIGVNVPLVQEAVDGILSALGSGGKLQVARQMPAGLPDLNGGAG